MHLLKILQINKHVKSIPYLQSRIEKIYVSIHSHETKRTKKSIYFLSCVTKLFDRLLLSYRGVKL